MKVGCCGFPEAMRKYFQTFEVVEVQKTFYEPPEVETLKRWRAQAPENFEFTVKAWQVITHPPTSPTYRRATYKPKGCGHFKPVKEVFNAWEKMKEVSKALRSRIILFQCPASFKQEKENIKNIYEFFRSISRSKDQSFIWEPRGKWSKNVIRDICGDLKLIHCVDPFKNKQAAGRFSYFRLHGIGGYNYKYTCNELKELFPKCNPSSYVLFNNIYMLENALEFKRMSERGRER